MRNKLKNAVAVLAAVLMMSGGVWAGTERVLYSFSNGTDGGVPIDSGHLIADRAGNFYGTTELGGNCGNGTVFKLAPAGGGHWTETVLHSFCGDEGFYLYAGLVADKAGNLYGTTTGGGASGGGTVFKLTDSGGVWTLTTLYNFTSGADGGGPYGGVIMDPAGNLYGPTVAGGVNDCRGEGCGTVFKLTNSGDVWTHSTIYSFTNDDGAYPYGGLIMDKDGNLYGTSQDGGVNGLGVVFQLTNSGSAWTATVLHSFGDPGDGQFPGYARLALYKGSLYGTVPYGGTDGLGIVFKLTKSGGVWNEKILYSFKGGEASSSPYAGLNIDGHGHIWGTTVHGGGTVCEAPIGCGTIFRLTPSQSGWVEHVIYRFTGSNGANPLGSLIVDAQGHLFGTTSQGGANDFGMIFEIRP